MANEKFSPSVNTDNSDPRVACVMLLDTSASMGEQDPDGVRPIDELNKGLKVFADDIKEDDLARKRAEVLVISFGGQVHSDPSFEEAQDFDPPVLTAQGNTPMGEAILTALDALEQQKTVYKQTGIEYFRPWLVVMSDGVPTDDVSRAVAAVAEAEKRKAVAVFPIGIGDRADFALLNRLSHERDAVKMRDVESFAAFFKWLSKSLHSVSDSQLHGTSDAALAQKAEQSTEQVALPDATGWTTLK